MWCLQLFPAYSHPLNKFPTFVALQSNRVFPPSHFLHPQHENTAPELTSTLLLQNQHHHHPQRQAHPPRKKKSKPRSHRRGSCCRISSSIIRIGLRMRISSAWSRRCRGMTRRRRCCSPRAWSRRRLWLRLRRCRARGTGRGGRGGE